MKYLNLLKAHDFDIWNSEPTRVTTKTRSCIDQLISEKCIYTETVSTTISDHYTIISKTSAESEIHMKKQKIMKVGDPKYLKVKELNFIFLLDQKLKQIPGTKTVNEQRTHVSKIIMDSVD